MAPGGSKVRKTRCFAYRTTRINSLREQSV